MLKVLFCGSRWLGIECLKELKLHKKDLEIVGAVVPLKNEESWWKDVIEEDELVKLNIKRLNWDDVKASNNIDLVFSVLHKSIFRKEFIDTVKLGIINLHPAPLPQYRGRNAPVFAILQREKKFGPTLHYVDEGVDTGPIISKAWLKINKDDTGYSLYKRTHSLAIKLFQVTLPKIIKAAKKEEKLKVTNQDSKRSRYYKKNSLPNKEVDLNWSEDKIYNFVRALQFPPFEPAYFMWRTKKIYLRVSNKLITFHNSYSENVKE